MLDAAPSGSDDDGSEMAFARALAPRVLMMWVGVADVMESLDTEVRPDLRDVRPLGGVEGVSNMVLRDGGVDGVGCGASCE